MAPIIKSCDSVMVSLPKEAHWNNVHRNCSPLANVPTLPTLVSKQGQT